MRRLLAIFCLLLTVNTYVFASFGGATAWDVRTTGVDTNGGAFDPSVGSPGTDESQGSGTAITVTLISGTTGTCSPSCTASTHGPGNFINIASGTGCATGWYDILSQSAGTITVDHTMGSAADTCVGVIGGSLLTPEQANANAVVGNTIWLQSGTYTITSTIDAGASGIGCVTNAGYHSTHGDLYGAQWANLVTYRPQITTATASTTIFYTGCGRSSGGTNFLYLALTCTAGTCGNGIESRNGGTILYLDSLYMSGFAKTVDCDNVGATYSCTALNMRNTEITAFSVFAAHLVSSLAQLSVVSSYIHDASNSAAALTSNSGAVDFIYNTVVARTGKDGFDTSAASYVNINYSAFDSNGCNGISLGATQSIDIENSVFWGHTSTAGGGCGYGLASGTGNYNYLVYNNGFGNNYVANCDGDGCGINVISLTTTNPWVSSTTGNYQLNTLSAGGALLKAAGFPGAGPFGTGYGDVNVLQSQGSGSGVTPYAY